MFSVSSRYTDVDMNSTRSKNNGQSSPLNSTYHMPAGEVIATASCEHSKNDAKWLFDRPDDLNLEDIVARVMRRR
jgi:hypothetical protein